MTAKLWLQRFCRLFCCQTPGNPRSEMEASKKAGIEASDVAEVDTFAPPKDTLGLHVLYEPQGLSPDDLAVDIVAVHGLGGDSFATWTDKESNRLWLKDFLPDSKYFRGSRIMTFGYDARPWLRPGGDPATAGRAFTFAESLLSALRSKRILTGTQRRPILFVGHSLGGIVIKWAMVFSHSRQALYKDIYDSTKAIAFFGTPHQGANIAMWSGYLENISKVVGVTRTNVLQGIETWSPSLLELQRTFSEQVPRLNITSFWEKQPYHGVFVVNEGSASLSSFNETFVGLDANHRTICKFASKDSSVYREVMQNLEVVIHEIQNPPQRVTERLGLATVGPSGEAANGSQAQELAGGPFEFPRAPIAEATQVSAALDDEETGSLASSKDSARLERRMRALRK